MDLAAFIRDIPDFPKPGIRFKDITPLLADPASFAASIEMLAAHYSDRKPDAIAAVEARGFLFAAPLALILRKPLIPLRKPGKLPYRTISLEYALEYGTAELHMHTDAVQPGSRVLMVDDVLATGGTMQAACSLIQKAGGTVHGAAFLVELAFLAGREKLQGVDVYSLVTY